LILARGRWQFLVNTCYDLYFCYMKVVSSSASDSFFQLIALFDIRFGPSLCRSGSFGSVLRAECWVNVWNGENCTMRYRGLKVCTCNVLFQENRKRKAKDGRGKIHGW
jgi:hypothetical protein